MQKEEFLKRIETELKITKSSEHTIKTYIKFNRSLLDFCKKQPEDIQEQDVKNFLAENLSNKAASSNMVALAAVRYAFSTILKRDPSADIKRPKREKTIPTVLTKEEITNLIQSAGSRKSRLIISLLYGTGMRVSELTNLKTVDLSFDEKIGYIRKAKGKKDRLFNIPNHLLNSLRKIAEQAKEERKEHLFPGPKGKLSERNIQKIVKKAAKKAGINKSVHCHTLRHSFATHLLEQGENIRKIQELLGHENLSTTEIYTHISTEHLKKVKSPLDNL